MTIPNLDAMPADELMKFWGRYHRPRRKDALELIGGWRKGYISIVESLAAYACNKAVAMKLRADGEIERATICERCCDISYQKLPEDLRW